MLASKIASRTSKIKVFPMLFPWISMNLHYGQKIHAWIFLWGILASSWMSLGGFLRISFVSGTPALPRQLAWRHNAPGPLRADRRPNLTLASPPDPPHPALLSGVAYSAEAAKRQCSLPTFSPPKFDLKFHLHFFRLFGIFEAKTLPKWSQNRLPNQIFGFFFAIFFSTAFLDRFCIVFWRLRPLKT